MAGDTRDFRVLNKFDRIRTARVQRDADVGVVDFPIILEDNVLEHRTETERLENIRLTFVRKVYCLRVATAFDVEDAVVAPDVFVVSDEMTLRIGREGRLPRAAESEEQRRHTALLVGCGRAMHREQTAR